MSSSAYHTYVWKGNNGLALTKWPVDKRLRQMSLGLYHSAFLTDEGRVLCCGQNSHGQLGIGSNEGTFMEPVVVAGLDDEVVTSVAVGLYHTVCGTKSGSVYSWGDSTRYQCGSMDLTHYTVPICVASFNSPVKKVDCCSTASVVLLADGRLFAWGSGCILQDTTSMKQQVLEPSPFRFIEERIVIDFSCGANFIIAVLKKTVATEKKLVTKNNYVIVHKSDSELEAFNNVELNRVSSSQNYCPLGLEVAEEHVCLSFSEQNSPASVRPFNNQLSRSSSIKSNNGSKLSRASSVSSLTATNSFQISELTEGDNDEDELEKGRSSSASAVCHHSVINVNKNEAEKWLKDRIGSQFAIKGEVPPLPNNGLVEEVLEPVLADPSRLRTRDKIPQYMESMWNSISSSSQAVSSAVQTHIVSKIPLLDKLKDNSGSSSSESIDSMSLTSMVKPSRPGDNTQDQREDNSHVMYKSVAARALRRTESSSTVSSTSASRANTEKREFLSSACIATEVWSWGSGDHGQLGHGDCLDRLQPCMITSLAECQIYRVECSHHCGLALATDGKVYGWGDNSNGQIIYKDRHMAVHPTVIPISLRIPSVDISLGSDHALLQVISPHNGVSKGGIFLTGSETQNDLGTRLAFTRSLGHKLCLSGGPNGVSSICVKIRAADVYQQLTELRATEIQLYRVLLDILTELVEPIIGSDYMTALLASSFGDCLKNMIENLFRLIDKIGLNTQELSAVADSADLENTSLVGNDKVYMKSFTDYAVHFHNFLAMNGFVHLVEAITPSFQMCGFTFPLDYLLVVVAGRQFKGRQLYTAGNSDRPLLLRNDAAITAIYERCQLEYSDELIVKVSVLLQLPLRRVSEYHELIEGVQLRLEDGSMLVSCLNTVEKEKLNLSSQFSLAESTRIFWEKCPKTLSSTLKEPHRRLVRESKSLSLNLVGASKLYKNWFILFNDVFVHVQGTVHKVYPLEKLWIEASTGSGSTHEYEMKLIMPEATLNVQTANTAEKAEWMWILCQTVSRWLASFKSGSAEAGPINHCGTILRTTPATRIASHMFYKSGALQSAVYKGQWRKGVMHGEGKITWADGRTYTGQFTDGEQTGYGKLTSKIDGSTETMEGYWKNGKLHGFAKTRYASGDSYTGFYKEHQFNGHGVLKVKSVSSVYVGEWKDGKKHGYGVSDSKGEKYLGQWVKDVKQGPGLQISLDGCYMEGVFTNNKLVGQGLIITSDCTYYEGNFTGLNEVNGKGKMVMSNGDNITGTFDGSWLEGIKVNGVFRKAAVETDRIQISLIGKLPECFGTLSAPHETKWVELFHHARVALGCQSNEVLSSSDCEKAWEKVAVLFANARYTQSKRRRLYSEQLEKIPAHDLPALSLQHYRRIRRYLNKACDCPIHPFGLLLKNLVDVYRTSYSGTGTHPRLLMHAREELLSITYRYYEVIRILFPEMPLDHFARKVICESALAKQQQLITENNQNGEGEGLTSASDHMTVGSTTDIQLIEKPIVEDETFEESEIITPTLLIFPMLLPKIYEPLFHLYALQNEATDGQYWSRVQRFNKQSDVTLLSYLGIPEKFWFMNDGNIIDSSLKSLEIQDECYIDAIDMLQRLSTCLTPAEKLRTVQLTFEKINTLVKENMPGEFIWSMDDLFPVFLFVVIRSRLRYLGSEIQFMDELMDNHLEYGELGLMFTTLKACHLQIQTEKLL